MFQEIIDAQIKRYFKLFILLLIAAIAISVVLSLTITGLWLTGICAAFVFGVAIIDLIKRELKKNEHYRRGGCTTCGGK